MQAKKTALSVVVGAAFVTGALLSPATHAADNPFAAKVMSSGYLQLADNEKGKDGKCGEGKCGADKAKTGSGGADKKADGKCGEGKCGADKAKSGSGGADKKKDGKCGEGKCGSAKK